VQQASGFLLPPHIIKKNVKRALQKEQARYIKYGKICGNERSKLKACCSQTVNDRLSKK